MTTADRYHHGDLPAALMAAVDQIVREGGVGAVTLREAARRVGVTHSAPAHHFGSKSGLLTAFAVEGFHLLREHMTAAIASSRRDDGSLEFTAVGLAYVEFAVEHPAHFAVMFRPEHVEGESGSYRQAAVEAFMVLVDAVREIRDDLAPDAPEIVGTATGAWSMTHGFATLWLDGNMAQLVTHGRARDAAEAAFRAFAATLVRAVQRDTATDGNSP